MEIAGRGAIVTGAGSGIGRATSLALAREGARILVVDVDRGQAEATTRLIRNEGGQAHTCQADVTSEADTKAMIHEAESRWGGVEIVHNNAGVLSSGRGGFTDTPVDAWLHMIDVNLNGVVLTAHAAIPAMQRRGGGALVQTASVAGLIAYPGSPIYAATKAAVVSFTRGLAKLKDEMGIRANCVCPEVVDTPPIQSTRQRARAAGISTPHMALPLIPPEEVAHGVLALIRDDTLAGQVMKISPNAPRELLEFPNWGVVRE